MQRTGKMPDADSINFAFPILNFARRRTERLRQRRVPLCKLNKSFEIARLIGEAIRPFDFVGPLRLQIGRIDLH